MTAQRGHLDVSCKALLALLASAVPGRTEGRLGLIAYHITSILHGSTSEYGLSLRRPSAKTDELRCPSVFGSLISCWETVVLQCKTFGTQVVFGESGPSCIEFLVAVAWNSALKKYREADYKSSAKAFRQCLKVILFIIQ